LQSPFSHALYLHLIISCNNFWQFIHFTKSTYAEGRLSLRDPHHAYSYSHIFKGIFHRLAMRRVRSLHCTTLSYTIHCGRLCCAAAIWWTVVFVPLQIDQPSATRCVIERTTQAWLVFPLSLVFKISCKRVLDTVVWKQSIHNVFGKCFMFMQLRQEQTKAIIGALLSAFRYTKPNQ